MERRTSSGSLKVAGMSQQNNSPAPSRLDTFHGEFASFEEQYIRNYIALADTKAAWTFTIASGVLAFLFSKDQVPRTLLDAQWSPSYLSLFGAAVLLILSTFYSSRVVAPRLKSPSGEGIVFFGAVARQPSADAYVSAVAAHDMRALTEARLRHCHDISRICCAKYSSLKKAIWLGLPGLVFALTYILIQ
jgi:pycsar effector protein